MSGGVKSPDRAFPVLTGLGAFLGVTSPVGVVFLSSDGPPLSPIFLPAFALVGALYLGTIRIRRGGLYWLGARYSLAAGAAVGLGLVFDVIIQFAFFWRPYGGTGFLWFLALAGILPGWFAFCTARWVDRDHVGTGAAVSAWDPRTWGAAGVLGASMALIAGVVLAASFAQPVPSLGPVSLGILYAEVASGILLALGLGGVVKEVRRPRVPRLSR